MGGEREREGKGGGVHCIIYSAYSANTVSWYFLKKAKVVDRSKSAHNFMQQKYKLRPFMFSVVVVIVFVTIIIILAIWFYLFLLVFTVFIVTFLLSGGTIC